MTSPFTKYGTLGTIVNESIWDGAVAGVGAYALLRGSTLQEPALLVFHSVAVASFQPMLTYIGFDGIFKKRAQFLSPILSTAFCNGLNFYALTHVAKLALSDDAKFNAASAIAIFAMFKGLTRHVFRSSIYPSLAPVAQLGAAAVSIPVEGVTSLFSSVVSSQTLRTAATKVSWLWKRNCEPMPEDKEV